MMTLLVLLLSSVLRILFYVVVIFVLLVIGLKLWLEPVKGVCKCTTRLHGRVALVTGGNSGIGLETAKDLAERGARVIIACRNADKSRQVVTDIINATGNADVVYKHLDLSDFDSIRSFVSDINETEQRLDILVNNAGCAGLKNRLTKDGNDIVMQVNYIGPFLLTHLLLDKLAASRPSRIVIVSSLAHYFAKLDVDDVAGVRSAGPWTTYANSKLCGVLWSRALSGRVPRGVSVNALHPGVVHTHIFSRMPPVPRAVLLRVIDAAFKSPREGAQTTIHLCVAPELADSSGGFYADCKPSRTLSLVQNDQIVEKVWKETLRLVKK